jgi:hypothetical protein
MKWNFREGDGYIFSQDKAGISMEVLPPANAIIDYPFKVELKKVDEILKAFVRAGTVNNVVPKISSKYLDDPTVDGVTVSTDDGIMDVLLKVTKGASPVFFPTESTIEVSSRPIPVDTDTNAYLVLASIAFTESGSATITQQIFSSQIVTRAKPGSSTAIWLFSSR